MPTNIQAQTNYPRQSISLSPETKSTLWSGAMASVLGATWLANTKVQGADSLLGLPDDKFESVTKKIAKLKDEAEAKQALSYFQQLRTELANKHVQQANELFGTGTEINVKDLFKSVNERITTTKKADAYTRLMEKYLNKIQNIQQLLISPDVAEKGVTAETYEALNKLFATSKGNIDTYKKAFETQFPIGSKPTQEEIFTFIEKQIQPLAEQYKKLNILKRIANCADETGKITKANAQNAFKRYNFDCILEEANQVFDVMRAKLPKARLKGAIKWFGIGIGISILSNMIFGLFTRKNK